MIRDKFIVKLRNQIASLAMDCYSSAAIEGSKMTSSERDYIQNKLREVVDYIDRKIY